MEPVFYNESKNVSHHSRVLNGDRVLTPPHYDMMHLYLSLSILIMFNLGAKCCKFALLVKKKYELSVILIVATIDSSSYAFFL